MRRYCVAVSSWVAVAATNCHGSQALPSYPCRAATTAVLSGVLAGIVSTHRSLRGTCDSHNPLQFHLVGEVVAHGIGRSDRVHPERPRQDPLERLTRKRTRTGSSRINLEEPHTG